MKRKYPEDDGQHTTQYGKDNDGSKDEVRAQKQVKLERGGDSGPPEPAEVDVDPLALKRTCLGLVRKLNDNAGKMGKRKNYLADRKNGQLHCIVCSRASNFRCTVESCMYTTHRTQTSVLIILGYTKLCMCSYEMEPDNSMAYQLLPADDATASRNDLVVWPPAVFIRNASYGKQINGQWEALGNKELDAKLKGCYETVTSNVSAMNNT